MKKYIHPHRCVRKNFDKAGGVICKECFQRDLVIDSLREELKIAKAKIRFLEDRKRRKVSRKALSDQPHTPSSQKRFKANSTPQNQEKKGGAIHGHKGHGRKGLYVNEISETVACPEVCPCCHVPLITKGIKSRTIVDINSLQAIRKKMALKRGQCPNCKKTYRGPVRHLPKTLYGNQLISQAITMHYLHGVSIGRLLQIFGPEVTHGGLINSFHSVGHFLGEAKPVLINALKASEVRNADETGWRTDGKSGYAWIFRSQNVTVFEHCESRGAKIPKAILGSDQLNGYLVVDRYNAYNKVPVKIQYCYAHLLREIAKLEKEFGENKEIQFFTKKMCSLMADAMNLQTLKLTDDQYLVTAANIKRAIVQEINQPYKHLGIMRIQQIFLKHKNRMYHWAENPRVPADNNRAEREIRSTVIARKTSFGSQSERGAKTRSNIMSVLFTVKKRLQSSSVENWLYQSLNQLSQNKNLKITDLIPPAPS